MNAQDKNDLYGEYQKAYPHTASECRFLLGGIGTGNISLNARGQLCDFELFNKPGKGVMLPYTFFALWTKDDAGAPLARVLEAEYQQPHESSHGYLPGALGGLPRLKAASLRARYPFVRVDFEDEELPLKISMESFTPFVPLNADASSYPGAVFRYRVHNRSKKPKPVTIAASLANAAGFEGFDLFNNMQVKTEGDNQYREQDGLKGIYMSGKDLSPDDLTYGTMAIATDSAQTTAKPTWLVGAWWDGAHDFWDDFKKDGRLEQAMAVDATQSAFNDINKLRIGTLGSQKTLAPGETAEFTFYLTWHFPNRPRAWQGHICKGNTHESEIVKTRVAALFSDAWDAAAKLHMNLPELERHSRNFARALFSSTLPPYVLEALADNITVIRSPTCFRLADGTFLAWEGCFPNRGCCEGNCTHVWNYAQTLAFLFPELERSMRRTEFLLETGGDGCMAFRTMQVFGDPKWDMLPAADGQMGAIIRLYRDWKLSGDDGFLLGLWPKAKQALEFALAYWDKDHDGVLESRQHNTYDIEFYGLNSLTNSLFYAALKAAAEIAGYLGEAELSKRYSGILNKGSARMDEALWEEDYYIQKLDDVNAHRYQYGKGCLSDQVFGQLLAHVNGLGYILPRGHVKEAVHAVYRYNFCEDMRRHDSVQRTYALNGEKGLLLCSWPHGGRPRLPFVYSDEVWTGIEYQVAAHLIYEGFIQEGLQIVQAVRERFNGFNRNPFNEIECGNHYARSLASWSLLLALSGYHADMVKGALTFAPAVHEDDFQCFFSTGTAWGIYTQKRENGQALKRSVDVLYGDLKGARIAP